MAEPPSKRRRPDSRQMWDASDRQAPLPSRERDEGLQSRDRVRRDDRDRDHDRRRYRSRSPRDSKGRGGRDDYRGTGRDDRGGRSSKGDWNDDGVRDSRDSRDRPRERSRERDRDRRRSRSPRREREREQEGRRSGELERDRPKSMKPEHRDDLANRSATPPVSFKVGGAPHPHESEKMDVDANPTKSKNKSGPKGKKSQAEAELEDADEDLVVEDDGMAAMQAMMGFGGFGTTHQKKVAGNDVYAVRKEKKTEYRQYMNRVGGFNRPLSPGRD